MNKKILSSLLGITVAASMSFGVVNAASKEGLANADPVTVPIVKSLHTNSLESRYLEDFTFNFEAIEVTDVPQATNGRVTMPTIGPITISASEWATANNETLNNGYAINKVINKASGNVVFKEVGTYLYKVTEGEIQSGSIESDGAAYWVEFDVYKGDGNKLAVQQVIYNSDPRTTTPTKTEAKFNNTVTCNEDIFVQKRVTGSRGDTTKEFSFTVTLSDNGNHNYVVQTLEGGTWTNTEVAGTITGGTQTFTLTHNQRVWIKGLNEGTTYNVTENLSAGDRLLYKTNIDVALDAAGTDLENEVSISGVRVLPTADGESNLVIFENNREAIANTGIILEIAPYVLLVGLSAGAFVVIQKSKKNKSELDK